MKISCRRVFASIGIGLGILVGATDWSIVQNALPVIQDGLEASLGELQWVMNSFGLFLTALLVTMGRFGDIYGRRRIFSIGLIIFGLACLGAALSPTPFALIVARAFQGVGFAMLIPTSQALLIHLFPEDQQGKAMGIWATLIGIGLVLGPVLGGIIVTFFSWHWIFYINIPFIIISYLMVRSLVKESKNEEHPAVLDIKGIVIIILGLGAFIFAIIEAPEWGWTHPVILASFVAAAVLFILFYFVEKGEEVPLIKFSLFKNRCFTAGALSQFSGCFLFWVTFFLVPLYLQNYRRETPWASGLILLSVGIPFAVISRFAGAAGDRIDKNKLITSGFFLAFIALLSLILIGPSTSITLICVILAVFGAGQAILWSPGTSLGLSALPRNQVGVASGALTTIQEAGGSVGIAFAGTIFTMVEKSRYRELIATKQIAISSKFSEKIESLLATPSELHTFLSEQAPQLHLKLYDIFRASFLSGFHSGMLLAVALAFCSMVTIFFLRKKKVRAG